MVAPPRAGRTVEKELFLPAPPERVFAAFTTPEGLLGWMSLVEVRFDPRPGGAWRFKWRGGDVAEGVVVEIDPPRRVVTDWYEAPHLGTTRLTVEFLPENGGTRLRLANSGFGSGGDWDALYDGVNSGWESGLEQLRAWMEVGR
jgi:uncharacterized protein YndB with AHSA1/START domain